MVDSEAELHKAARSMREHATKRHPTPSLAKAVAFLERYIESRDLQGGDRLPAARNLVAESGVSYVTFSKALRELRATGKIAVAGGCYRVAPVGLSDPQKASAPTPVPQKTWQRVSGALSQDLIDRVFRPTEPLPSTKVLARRYGVAYRTLKKSLHTLVNQGILHVTAAGKYAVSSYPSRRGQSRIVCISNSLDSTSIAFGLNDEAVYRALEMQCEQAGVGIDLHLLFLENGSGPAFLRARSTGAVHSLQEFLQRKDESVLGYLYMMQLGASECDATALAALARGPHPLAILNETSAPPPVDLGRARQTHVFTAAISSRPGEIVGRRLLALGHRKITFVSPYDGLGWSRLRQEGVTTAFRAADMEEGVVPLLAAASQFAFEQGGRMFHIEPLVKYYQRWHASVGAPYRAGFDEAFEKIRYDTCESEFLRSAIVPLLDKALLDPKITAWVMVNDHAAGMAIDYLRSKGISLPADLSLVSFDDSPLAMRKGIASYSFNPAAIAGSILGHLLNQRPYCDDAARVEGFIVNRGTLGPPGANARYLPKAMIRQLRWLANATLTE